MAEKTVLHHQTATDMTMLTYGNQKAYFLLHQDNEEMITENGHKIPEMVIPAPLNTGDTVVFDETHELYELSVAKTYSREDVEPATNPLWLGDFNNDFSTDFF